MALGPTTPISGEYLSIFTLSPYSGDSCLKICALKLPGILVNMFQNNGSLRSPSWGNTNLVPNSGLAIS